MRDIYFIWSMVLLTSCLKVNCTTNSPEAITDNGVVQGVYDSSYNVYKFLGIPYAKPPVNELRWKAPKPLENWEGVYKANKFGNSAMQINVWGDMIYRSDTVSEDCLYLNVWTPVDASIDSMPVLVYFHGGGLIAGCGSEPRYDGAAMAKKGIVAVTVNYRLNIFGFFAHELLSAETAYSGSGNYGLLDQVAALKWVKKNIASFGGNPNKITIAGESAGSISVSSHMVSPLTKNIIAGAIGQSGAAINPTREPKLLSDAEQIGEEFMQEAGYTDFNEFRKLSTKELFALYLKSDYFRFPTVIDNYFCTKTLAEAFKKGEQAKIPLLLGWTSAELPVGAFMKGLTNTTDNFISVVKQKYPNNYNEVLAIFPHKSKTELEQSASDLASDEFIVYSTWKWADLHLKYSAQPVYRYLFSQIRPYEGAKPIGAAHATDIEYFMGNLHLSTNFDWTTEDYQAQEFAFAFISNFVKNQNPNSKEMVKWEPINRADSLPTIMNINSSSKAFTSTNEKRWQFFNRFYK